MAGFIDRMMGAAKLQVATFEEVEADKSGTVQALAVVALSSLAAGIGFVGGGIGALVLGTLGSIVGWAIWAALIWVIGTKLLPESQTRADWGEIARATGFAQSAGVLRFFGFIPIIGPLIVLIASIWMLVATVIAVRQALDYESTWRAVGVVIIGFLINVVLLGVLGGLSPT